MPTYRIDVLLTPEGWRRDAAVTVREDGLIAAIGPAAEAAADAPGAVQPIRGIVVPGMPNAHSHAFQGAMAGDQERRHGRRDSFWGWRETMYALANRIEPADLELIATQLFIGMLRAGYTSVGEFHYLHRPSGGGGAPAGELWWALDRAAAAAGIALTLLPALYASSDFGDRPLRPEQRRFGLELDEFLQAVAARWRSLQNPGGAIGGAGAALHSLRAVPLPMLRAAVPALRAIDPRLPIHIHVAEQAREVRACRAATGRRPIELLLETGLLDPGWCLVHATHASAAEIGAVGGTGASICLCPSTEGHLGDGPFDAPRALAAGIGLCIGSDSQVCLDPCEELRWLEYQQRLRRRRRAVLATPGEPSAGARLWRECARTGARALGQNAGALEPGRRADWLVLDAGHADLAGAAGEAVLDRLVFAGGAGAIRDVMVAGRWVIRDRQHPAAEQAAARFAAWRRTTA